MKALLWVVIIVVIGLAGFMFLNSYIYDQKQATDETGTDVGELPQVMPEENFEGEANPDVMTLSMTTWNWIQTTYNNGDVVRPDTEGEFTLTFNEDDKTFSATTDCNGIGGNYTMEDGNRLTFGDMVSTLMFCEDSQETEFREMLENTSSYSFTSRGELVLDLKFDSGSVIFR